MDIKETNIYANFKQSVYNEESLDVMECDANIVFHTLIGALTKRLATLKNKDKPVAIVYSDNKGEFLLGGVVKYHPNETEPEMPGNFTYELSFNKEDIVTDDTVIVDSNDSVYQAVMASFIETQFHAKLSSIHVLPRMIPIAIRSIINWLDENAKDKEITLEVEPYYTCSAIIEKGIKILTISPSAEMKRLIKDDSLASSK